jgi:hypothetical protein
VTTTDIDRSASALRAFLTQDFATFHRLHDGLDPDGRRAFAAVLTAAFGRAVDHRFGAQHMQADIIEFVAEARARYPTSSEMVSADAAERVIKAALGEESLIEGLSGRVLGAAQNAMLFALVHEHDTPPEKMDALLAEAAKDAESYFRRRASQ